MRNVRIVSIVASLVLLVAVAAAQPQRAPTVPEWFQTSDRCQACHNGLTTPGGRDVSVGTDWRSSMMAHSAGDPYWHAAVRREVLEHAAARAEIEHECSRCHMPMAHVTQVAAGGKGQAFANLPIPAAGLQAPLASDGVSCTVCHQIQPEALGTRASFTGHFVVDLTRPAGTRQVFGPFVIDPGRRQIMRSATDFEPEEGAHIRSSELCATCHTLYTSALGEGGVVLGELPEQVPFLEWQHSAYRGSRSCQSCHMPVVAEAVRMSSTLGEPRDGVARHTFRGANFWMLRALNRFRDEVGVITLPQELELAARDSTAQLREDSASLSIARVLREGDRLVLDVRVVNRAGHKLPTAYPSRRVWLHVAVRDEAGRVLFESGAVRPDGRIEANDNDMEPSTYEPHHREITSPAQVQIYEDVIVDRNGVVTTGLLSGVRYVKDNRLLPDGFDKSTAVPDVAVHGEAADDPDFAAGGDEVRYTIAAPATGALMIDVALRYQSVGFRWAQNLRQRPSPETDRFVRYYESMSTSTAETLARALATAP